MTQFGLQIFARDLFNSWVDEGGAGTPHRSLIAIKTRLTLLFQMVKK